MLTFGNDPMSLNGGGNVGLIPTSALGKPDASSEAAAGTIAITGDKPKVDNKTAGMEKSEKTKPTRECQTCKNRKYQDGSNEMVSFKSAAHISPTQAPSAVRAHEQEHVSNAYKKAAQNDGKVLQASVAIHTAVCPECGRVYVSGGTTTTKIKYGGDDNPYEKARKAQKATGNGGFANFKV